VIRATSGAFGQPHTGRVQIAPSGVNIRSELKRNRGRLPQIYEALAGSPTWKATEHTKARGGG
jgi:hypothetical protein